MRFDLKVITVCTQAALAEHDDKLAELERRRSTLQPLLRLVEKVEDLFDERTKLVAIQADPARASVLAARNLSVPDPPLA
jgi:hypothetical protein